MIKLSGSFTATSTTTLHLAALLYFALASSFVSAHPSRCFFQPGQHFRRGDSAPLAYDTTFASPWVSVWCTADQDGLPKEVSRDQAPPYQGTLNKLLDSTEDATCWFEVFQENGIGENRIQSTPFQYDGSSRSEYLVRARHTNARRAEGDDQDRQHHGPPAQARVGIGITAAIIIILSITVGYMCARQRICMKVRKKMKLGGHKGDVEALDGHQQQPQPNRYNGDLELSPSNYYTKSPVSDFASPVSKTGPWPPPPVQQQPPSQQQQQQQSQLPEDAAANLYYYYYYQNQSSMNLHDGSAMPAMQTLPLADSDTVPLRHQPSWDSTTTAVAVPPLQQQQQQQPTLAVMAPPTPPPLVATNFPPQEMPASPVAVEMPTPDSSHFSWKRVSKGLGRHDQKP